MTIRLSHSKVVPDGELTVEVNTANPASPFATIDLDEHNTYLVLKTVGDADRLIRAAVAAKDLLIEATGAQVRVPDPDECTCGHRPADHIFAHPSPCTKCGCKGFYAAAAAILAKAIEDGTPVIVTDDEDKPIAAKLPDADRWCTSRQRRARDLTVLCELRSGHDGPHRSPGYDPDDPDITWTDYPGICPAGHPSGAWGCTLPEGHDGPHKSVDDRGHVRKEWADATEECRA